MAFLMRVIMLHIQESVRRQAATLKDYEHIHRSLVIFADARAVSKSRHATTSTKPSNPTTSGAPAHIFYPVADIEQPARQTKTASLNLTPSINRIWVDPNSLQQCTQPWTPRYIALTIINGVFQPAASWRIGVIVSAVAEFEQSPCC